MCEVLSVGCELASMVKRDGDFRLSMELQNWEEEVKIPAHL